MPDHYCLKEREWGELNVTLNFIKDKLTSHVVEGEREGGHRDILRDTVKRVDYLEKQTKELKSEIKRSSYRSGIIGGAVVYALTNIPGLIHVIGILVTKLAFAGQ